MVDGVVDGAFPGESIAERVTGLLTGDANRPRSARDEGDLRALGRTRTANREHACGLRAREREKRSRDGGRCRESLHATGVRDAIAEHQVFGGGRRRAVSPCRSLHDR